MNTLLSFFLNSKVKLHNASRFCPLSPSLMLHLITHGITGILLLVAPSL